MKGVMAVFHPGKETAVNLDLWGSLKIYYSMAIISVVLAAIAITVMSALGIYSSGGLNPFGRSIAAVMPVSIPVVSIVSAMIGIFVAVPIILFIVSIVYQLIGKNFLNAWKGGYEKTFAAVMFSLMPTLLFYWAISIPVIGVFLAFIFGIWSFVVLVIALSSQHHIERYKSVIVVLVSEILSIALVLILMMVFAFGIFSSVITSPLFPSNVTAITPGITSGIAPYP